jgi:hypothetical protein
MALSHIAARLAAEIRDQDWSDAHVRLDGSRHNRAIDRTGTEQLPPAKAEAIRLNVVWVVGQALAEEDPNFSIREFAEASGVGRDFLLTRRGGLNGGIEAGIRPIGRDVVLETDGRTWVAVNNGANPSAQPTSVSFGRAASPVAAASLLTD